MSDTEKMMEFLFENRAPSLPPAALAKVFDILSWSMNDEGGEILRVCRKWLEGSDRQKVEICLAMEDTFPAKNRETMVALFSRITRQWPDLAQPCDAILGKWDRQFGV